MINKKKIFMMGGIAAVFLTVSLAFVYENSYSSVSAGMAQYGYYPFDDHIEHSEFVLIGTVVDKETVLLRYDMIDTDENGTEYIFSTSREPFEKVTLRVEEYLRDTTGQFDSMMVVYEMYVDGIGWKDGVRTMFYKPDPQTYELGEQHVYFVDTQSDHPGKIIIGGFDDRFDIIFDNGTKYIHSEADVFFGDSPRLYSDAVNLIDSINNGTMTSDMIQKQKNYKP